MIRCLTWARHTGLLLLFLSCQSGAEEGGQGDPLPKIANLVSEEFLMLNVGESFTVDLLAGDAATLTEQFDSEQLDVSIDANKKKMTIVAKKPGQGKVELASGDAIDSIGVISQQADEIYLDGLYLKFVNRFVSNFREKMTRDYMIINVVTGNGVIRFDYFMPDSADLKGGYFPLGHYALGYDPITPDGNRDYMVVVRAAEGHEDLLAKPLDYTLVWSLGGSNKFGIWRPEPPPGYVAMGLLFGPKDEKPDVNTIRVVKKSLTTYSGNVAKKWDDRNTGHGYPDWSIWQVLPVKQPGNGYFTIAPMTMTSTRDHETPPNGQPEMNVFRIKIPVVYRSKSDRSPQLESRDRPIEDRVKAVGEVIMLPFFAVKDDSVGLDYKIKHSPMYRVARYDEFRLERFFNNKSASELSETVTITTGADNSQTTSMQHEAGIDISTEFGIEALGATNKIALHYKFTYATSKTIRSYTEQKTTTTVKIPPNNSIGFWQSYVIYQAQRYSPSQQQWQSLNEVEVGTDDTVLTGFPPQ